MTKKNLSDAGANYDTNQQTKVKDRAKTVKDDASETVADDFIIVDYSEKSIAVFGDTQPIKDFLRAFGGFFNARLKYQDEKRAGWVFPKKQEQKVRYLLTNKPLLQ